MSETCQKHSCALCPMRLTTEWAELSDGELALLDLHKKEVRYEPGDILYYQGDENGGVHCIHTGVIALRRLDQEGNSVLIKTAYPGDTIGYRSFLKKGLHATSAEVLSPANICTLEKSTISKLLRESPDLGFRFLKHSLDDLEDIEDRLVQCRTWPVRQRLLHTLLVFNEHYGAKIAGAVHRIELPVSRRDLASIVGTTPEATSRQLRDIQDEGLVQVNGREILIHDIDRVLGTLPLLG